MELKSKQLVCLETMPFEIMGLLRFEVTKEIPKFLILVKHFTPWNVHLNKKHTPTVFTQDKWITFSIYPEVTIMQSCTTYDTGRSTIESNPLTFYILDRLKLPLNKFSLNCYHSHCSFDVSP